MALDRWSHPHSQQWRRAVASPPAARAAGRRAPLGGAGARCAAQGGTRGGPGMRHPARWAALAVGVVVAVLGIVLATQVGTNPQADTQTSRLVGQREPTFNARTFDGQAVSSTGLAGRAVIVNFWNSWCTPCQQELPALKTFQEEHAADLSVAFVGILRDDTVSAARAYASATGMTWTLVGDPDSNLSLAFGTRGQPETFAISSGGLIVGSQIGPASVKNLDTMLAAARATP